MASLTPLSSRELEVSLKRRPCEQARVRLLPALSLSLFIPCSFLSLSGTGLKAVGKLSGPMYCLEHGAATCSGAFEDQS